MTASDGWESWEDTEEYHEDEDELIEEPEEDLGASSDGSIKATEANGVEISIGDSVRVISIEDSNRTVFVAKEMGEYVNNGLRYKVANVFHQEGSNPGWIVDAGGWNWGAKDLEKICKIPPKDPEPFIFDPDLLDI